MTRDSPSSAARLNLGWVLEERARDDPGREAVLGSGVRLTYAQVNAAASQVANLLVSGGFRPGDAAALSCPNRSEFPILYYGILKAGGVIVPINVLLNARDIAHHLRDSAATVFFCWAGMDELPLAEHGRAAFTRVEGCKRFIAFDGRGSPLAEMLNDHAETFESVATSPQDTAAILYPSRTPGTPKGVELTHGNLVDTALGVAALSDGAAETHLVALPLFHAVAQTMQMNAGFATGGTLVLLPRFEAGPALETMAGERVTAMVGVPTMYWALVEAAPDHTAAVQAVAARLRAAYSELAPLPEEIRSGFARQFGTELFEGYGLSETTAVALHARPGANQPGSVGTPLDGVEVRLVDANWRDVPATEPGEIAVRGPNVMKRYHGRPSDTAQALRDRWFRTGDTARRDAAGLYYMDERPKRMVLHGGLAVYPRAVEEALITHPAVSTAVVVGIPHPHQGEELKTLIVRKPGAVVSEAELVAWCRQQMPGFADAVGLEIRDETPVTTLRPPPRRFLPGIVLVAAGVAAAFLVNRVIPVVSPLTAGVLLGALITNTVGVSARMRPGLTLATRRLLRGGVVLLGLQLSIPQLLGLGGPMLAAVVATVLLGFLGTRWIGARLGLSRDLALLTATGFSICGASAIAAMESATDSDEDEVATAVALVTIFGGIALLVWPLLQAPLTLPDVAYGAWTGASVHEVAQVVAAASPAGDASLATAVVVKLSRVVLLAPLVAAVTIAARRRGGGGDAAGSTRTTLVPAFVLGFLGMIALRSTGILPDGALDATKLLTTGLLTAALFGLGTGVRLLVLLRTGLRAVALGAASTLLLAAIAYVGVAAVTGMR
jgi:long-chain acyl-CoA synthetase